MSDYHQEQLSQAHIAIAVLETKVDAQGKDIERLTKMVETLAAKLDAVASTLTEARGGWRAMMLLGGAGATFGGLIAWAVEHVLRAPK
jgi:hypothetical protein